jgi:hypothetical protein
MVSGGAERYILVSVLAVAYWPPGQAFCIFFGATPASGGDEIRAASAVNIVGRIKGDLSGLWDVPDGAEVSISK